MKRMIVNFLVTVIYLCGCYGQEEEGCIRNFANLESAILNNSDNQYQIARAYFPLRRELYPVCVTSYYYLGINKGAGVAKQSCPTDVVTEGIRSGCLKWQWCINTFYLVFDLPQLEAYSFYILLDTTSEVELELPPVCNINETVLYEYFHRITVSLYHYARNMGQLGRGIEFIGYAARFLNNSDLEKLTFVSKPGSVDALIDNNNYSIDIKALHIILLILGLLSLPTFTTIFILFVYLEHVSPDKDQSQANATNCNQPRRTRLHSIRRTRVTRGHLTRHIRRGSNQIQPADEDLGLVNPVTEDTSRNVKYIVLSFFIICALGIGAMLAIQVIAFSTRWFYLVSYIWLLILILVNFRISLKMVSMIEDNYRLTKLHFRLEGILLGMFTMTMQLLSWHLVFVFYGFVLIPLRAFLYSMSILVSVACLIILLAVVLKIFSCIWRSRCKNTDLDARRDDTDGESERDKIIIMLSIVMLLIYTYMYCLFILHINISNNETLDALTKSLIPKIFLIMITWFLYKMLLNPKKKVKYWLLPKMFMDPMEIWKHKEKTGATYQTAESNA